MWPKRRNLLSLMVWESGLSGNKRCVGLQYWSYGGCKVCGGSSERPTCQMHQHDDYSPFSKRQHLRFDDCPEIRWKIIRTVLCCIVYTTVICSHYAHSYEPFLQVNYDPLNPVSTTRVDGPSWRVTGFDYITLLLHYKINLWYAKYKNVLRWNTSFV